MSNKYLKDKRPLDQWGNPIGKAYEDKRWDELTPRNYSYHQ